MKNLALLVLTLFVATPLIAQVSQERQILVTPNAEHPQIAKDSGLGGRVTAYVTVDQAGNVISVGDVTGPGDVCPSVTRADVVALREAARAAAINAKFSAGSTDVPVTIPLAFSFPERAVNRGGTDGKFTVKGDRNYSASNTPPSDYVGPVSVARAPDGKSETKSSDRFTVIGDRDVSAANAPPPDYTGPVATGGSSSSAASGSRNISGGVLNGKAVSLPKPPYPAAARAVRASGAVTIQVLIIEDGTVFTAAPVSGHPLLRSAARQAACGAAFSPTYLEGSPVKVSGVITYNFVP